MSARQMIKDASGLNLTALAADRAVAARMAELGQRDEAAYLRAITPAEMQALIELVVVPESWMFRDPQAFVAATAFVRDTLARTPQRTLRVLSIPCAGGEEPYSIAMSLADAGVPAPSVKIDAVDLSEVSLERARRGRYTRNAFRGGDLAFRERHFTQIGNEYQIADHFRESVNFKQGNLTEMDAISLAGAYDVIFCRNLLIYFDDATTAGAIARLRLMLDDDGVMFAGYAEVPVFCANGFRPIRTPGAFALQKERRTEPRLSADAPAPLIAPAPAPVARVVPPRRPTAPVPTPVAAPPDAKHEVLRARALADQGQLDAAAAVCNAVLARQPDCADALFMLGVVSECSKQPAQASDYWRRCVYLQPNHYEALCHLALLAEQQGDRVQAAAFRQRAGRVFGKSGSRVK